VVVGGGSMVQNLEGYRLEELNAAPVHRGGGGGLGGGSGDVDEVEQVPQSYPGRGMRMLGSEGGREGGREGQGQGEGGRFSCSSDAGQSSGSVPQNPTPDGYVSGSPQEARGRRGEGGGARGGGGEQMKTKTVVQREYETWEEVGRRQRKINNRGFDMEGMLQGDGLDADLADTMDSRALAQVLTRFDKMHSDLVKKALDALSALAERGDRRAVRLALEQMDTTHNYVRGVAVEALETLSGAPGIRAAVASVLAGEYVCVCVCVHVCVCTYICIYMHINQ
jgi:hypothetical protein